MLIMTRRMWRRIIVIAAALVVLWVAPRLIWYYTEWLWFGEVGYRTVFWTRLWTSWALGLAAGALFFLLVMGNALLARRLASRTSWYEQERRFRQEVAEVLEYYVSRYLGPMVAVFVLLVSYGVGRAAAGQWYQLLWFLHPTSFHAADPIFGKDLSFYMFRLPFYEALWRYAYLTLFAVLVISAAVHYFDKAIRVVGGLPAFAPHVKAHLSVILGLILATKAVGYWLDRYGLLYSDQYGVHGASYTAVHAELLAFKILMVIAGVCAVVAIVNLRYRGLWAPLGAIGFLFIASLLVGEAYPYAMQRLQVVPNEFPKEKPYIAYHIDFTRRAYGLDRIEERRFPDVTPLTAQTLANDRPTVDNVRLWHYEALQKVYQEQQGLRPYYRFNSVDIDRYTIDGRYRQVMLSARELWSDKLPGEGRQGWLNQHVYYTHGYGVAMSPVSEVGAAGLPVLYISDIPPVSAVDVKVTRPAVYFGELTDNYVLVRTREKEIDYPQSAAGNAYTTYSGRGGVNIGGGWRKLCMSARFGAVNILLATFTDANTRIMFRRNIRERAAAIAPFLQYDEDPYVVVSGDGKLYWIHDAYTVSSRYPYSQPYGAINYIRNSVKVVTDAYDGTITFYVADSTDPIIQTYAKIFPGAFIPMDRMPADLRQHVRYPEMLFNVQTDVYARYHMTDPRTFYNNEDRWQIAQWEAQRERAREAGVTPGREGTMEAYYVIMRLPEEQKAEFLLMIPYTPFERNNMIAWLAAKCDGTDYGKLVVYEFPKKALVWGPTQIEARIEQNPEISEQFTLWRTGGSGVDPGNLLVIPIGSSVLYVEPIYLRAAKNPIPQLARVIVSADSQVAMQSTLQSALAQAVGAPVAGPPAAVTPPALGVQPPPRLAAEAQAQYQRAQERLKAGDLSGFELEWKKLGDILNQIGGSPPPRRQ
jgi:hypothetical protein